MVKNTFGQIFRSKTAIHLLIISLLGIIVYFNSINGEFIRDDHELIKNNVYLKNWVWLPKILTQNVGAGAGIISRSYRPAQMLSYMIGHSLYGLDVRGYHLSNILLHIFVSLAIYWFIALLFKDNIVALFTGLLYVSHPLHTGAVAYISGRADSLAFLFMLLSFIYYVKDTRVRVRSHYIFSIFSFILSLLSKEICIIYPLLLLIYHASFNEPVNKRLFTPVSIITVIYLVLRLTLLRQFLLYSSTTSTAFERIPGFFVAITNYLVLAISPVHLKIDYGNALFSVLSPKAILGAAIFSGSIIIAVIFRHRSKIVFFSVLWFFAALIPSSNIYNINAYMAEHWLYIPLMGFCLLFAGGFRIIYDNLRLRLFSVILFILIIFLYSQLTIEHNSYWSSPLAFYKRMLKYTLDLSGSYNGLGLVYYEDGLNEEAMVMFKKAIAEAPNEPNINLALVYHDLGRDGEAIALLKKAIAKNPNFVKSYNNLAMIYHSLDRDQEAIRLYDLAIELNPNYTKAYYNLANLRYDLGHNQEAIDLYKKAIELDPYYHKTYYNLGLAYQTLGETDNAEVFYKKAISLSKDYLMAYMTLSSLYQSVGRSDEAITLCKKAIRIYPDSAEAYYNLANAYRYLKNNKEAVASYEKAVVLKPDFFDAYYNLGNAYSDNGDYKLALGVYLKALSLNKDYVPLYYNLGNAYIGVGMVKEAIGYYKEALKHSPFDPKIHVNLSTAYLMNDELESALEHFNEAVRLGVVDQKLSEKLKDYAL